MRDTDYAYCVARIRANERYLLKDKDLSELLECKSYDRAQQYLIDKKWLSKKGSITESLKYQSEKLWELLSESVPDKKELDILCVTNDFFNIKAAVKCHFTDKDPSAYYIQPTTLNLKELSEKVASHKFSAIEGVKGKCAEESYKTACLTENGQNADIIIDRACIDEMKRYADKKGDSVTGEISAFLCDTANIKIAFRCAETNKKRDFTETAIGECKAFPRKDLVEATLKGKDSLTEYLAKTFYREGAEIYLSSAVGTTPGLSTRREYSFCIESIELAYSDFELTDGEENKAITVTPMKIFWILFAIALFVSSQVYLYRKTKKS